MRRRENAASQTPHEDGLRYENTAPPHSSFRAKARNLFRSREGKGCERNGKREAPCSLRPEKRCFMQTAPRRKKNTANEKDPSAALGMTIRECLFPTHDFHPSARTNLRPLGAPPSMGRRENAASLHLSFRAKARNLFRSRQGKGCERSGKREPPCSLRPPKTVFHADRSTQEKEHGKRKRSLSSARDDDTRILSSKKRRRSRHLNPEP